jgi:putative addiction module killer protein
MRIFKSGIFIKWLKRLKDRTGKVLIAERIFRLKNGNFGDCDSVGDSIYEMRIHYGPGYQVYFKDTGNEIILLLCGDDKSTQKADIIKAKEIAKLPLEDYEEE